MSLSRTCTCHSLSLFHRYGQCVSNTLEYSPSTHSHTITTHALQFEIEFHDAGGGPSLANGQSAHDLDTGAPISRHGSARSSRENSVSTQRIDACERSHTSNRCRYGVAHRRCDDPPLAPPFANRPTSCPDRRSIELRNAYSQHNLHNDAHNTAITGLEQSRHIIR